MKIGFIGNLSLESVLPEDCIRAKIRGVHVHPTPWIAALLPHLAKISGYQLRIFLPSWNVTKHVIVEKDGVEYEAMPCRVPNRFNYENIFLGKSLAIGKYVRAYNPDLIHAFGMETGSAKIALRTGYPTSCFIQGIAEDYCPYSSVGLIHRQVMLWAERSSAKQLKWIVAEAKYAKKWALKYNKEARVSVIPHPLREDFLNHPVPIPSKKMISIGTMGDHKGMDIVLRAFAKVKDNEASLCLVGNGPKLNDLKNLASGLGIGNKVEFTGALNTQNVIAKMRDSGVYVIASRVDTSPNVLTEAHAIGLPVIGTRVGGIPEMIDEGVDGYLVDMDDTDALAEKMGKLLSNQSLCGIMGKAGREKVMILNDPKRIAEAHFDFFNEINTELKR